MFGDTTSPTKIPGTDTPNITRIDCSHVINWMFLTIKLPDGVKRSVIPVGWADRLELDP